MPERWGPTSCESSCLPNFLKRGPPGWAGAGGGLQLREVEHQIAGNQGDHRLIPDDKDEGFDDGRDHTADGCGGVGRSLGPLGKLVDFEFEAQGSGCIQYPLGGGRQLGDQSFKSAASSTCSAIPARSGRLNHWR